MRFTKNKIVFIIIYTIYIQTTVPVFVVITTFWLLYPLAFIQCIVIWVTYKEF